jgi:hypothetical protein
VRAFRYSPLPAHVIFGFGTVAAGVWLLFD